MLRNTKTSTTARLSVYGSEEDQKKEKFVPSIRTNKWPQLTCNMFLNGGADFLVTELAQL